MTVQSVIREVCSFVGVRPPSGTVFVSPYQDRTPWEFVNLANEMAQRIAYDTRDWTALKTDVTFLGNGIAPTFPLPSNYQRMLMPSNVWRSTSTQQPMRFIPDADEFLQRRAANETSAWGEWIILNDQMYIYPIMPVGTSARFVYLDKNCVRLNGGGYSNSFVNDADTFRLSERLLKLALIWQWKANKGASYAEDLANYEDALAKVAGADKPSPILVGPRSISADATIAYYGPTPGAGTFVGPGP